MDPVNHLSDVKQKISKKLEEYSEMLEDLQFTLANKKYQPEAVKLIFDTFIDVLTSIVSICLQIDSESTIATSKFAQNWPRINKIKFDEEPRIPLKKIEWHGLTKDEPLVFRKIMKSCYANPDRLKYPDFFTERDWTRDLSLYTKDTGPQYWIDLLKPGLISRFDAEKIRLHSIDQMYMKSSNRELIDAKLYLKQLKESKWCGPYAQEAHGFFYFVSVIEAGNNEYFASIYLNVNSDFSNFLMQIRCKNCNEISPAITRY